MGAFLSYDRPKRRTIPCPASIVVGADIYGCQLTSTRRHNIHHYYLSEDRRSFIAWENGSF